MLIWPEISFLIKAKTGHKHRKVHNGMNKHTQVTWLDWTLLCALLSLKVYNVCSLQNGFTYLSPKVQENLPLNDCNEKKCVCLKNWHFGVIFCLRLACVSVFLNFFTISNVQHLGTRVWTNIDSSHQLSFRSHWFFLSF